MRNGYQGQGLYDSWNNVGPPIPMVPDICQSITSLALATL
jgi:hypothetical protein